MLQHKTELQHNDDGSVFIDIQLHGNQTELATFALGKVHGGFVANTLPTGEPNLDELHIRLKLVPVPVEVVTDEPSKEDVKKLEHKARGGKSHDDEDHKKAKSA